MVFCFLFVCFETIYAFKEILQKLQCLGEHLTEPCWQCLVDFGNTGYRTAAVAMGEDGCKLLIDRIIL